MKKALLLLLFALALRAAGQNTTISSSMVDSDGIAWASGIWRIDFRPNPSFPNESTYRLLNGQPLSATVLHQNGALSSSGAFSFTIYDSTLVAPQGSGWTLTLCSLTIAPCGTYQFSSAGSSMDISSRLTTAIAAPRFPPNSGAFGYADVEVIGSLNQGAMYWNVTTQSNHIWNGVAWVAGGGGTGGGYPGVVTDNNNGLTITGGTSSTTNITSGPPMVDIRHPSFAGGAKCNGVADDGPAIQAAINTNTGGGQILIPGTPSACVWNNPTAFVWPSHNSISFNIQGTLKVGTTLPIGGSNLWQCLGGAVPGQFQIGSPCLIQGPSNTSSLTSSFTPSSSPVTSVGNSSGGNATYVGTFAGCAANACAGNYYTISYGLPNNRNIGTFQAIASTLTALTVNNPNAQAANFNGTAWLLAPVTISSTTGIFAPTAGAVSTGISIVDTLTCTPTSLQRLGDGVSVYAVFPSACHIPTGSNITVSGMTDSSYNGTFLSTYIDYVQNIMYWRNSGTAGTTTSGGTISGFNEDTTETVGVVALNGNQLVANFSYAHSAGALIGISGVRLRSSWTTLKDLKISSSGTALWLDNAAQDYLDNISVGYPSTTSATSALEVNQSFWIHMHHMQTMTGPGFQGWSVLMTNPPNGPQFGQNVTGFINDDGLSVFMGGIKFNNGASSFSTKDSIFERVAKGAILLDSRAYNTYQSTPNSIILHNTGLQDNLNNYLAQFVIASEYGGAPKAEGTVTGTVGIAGGVTLMNDYYSGKMEAILSYGNAVYGTSNSRGVVGTLNNGQQIEGEIRSIGSNGGPQFLPFATAGVPQNPANWGTNCTVSSGIQDPFGGTGAGTLTVASGTSSSRIYNYGGLTPHQGDYILYGAWVQAPESVVDNPSTGAFYIDNTASPNFTIDNGQTGSPTAYDMAVGGDWWHSIVALSSITSSNNTGGQTIRFGLNCQAGITSAVYMPWMMYIPAVVTTAASSTTTTSISVASGTGIKNGMQITGTGIGGNIIVLSGGGTASLILNQAVNVASGATLTFQYPYKEMARIRSQMLHGPIPSNASAGQLITSIPLTSSAPITAPIQDNGGEVFNVKAFGAVGDGVTDDAPAVQNATNAAIAAGGGTVFFPKGTYYFNSTPVNANGFIWSSASHMHFKCDSGANLTARSTGTTTLFYLGYPSQGLQTKTGFHANVMNYIGSPTITLTTPTDTSNFAVGDPIYIIGAPSVEANGDGELNVITAINTTTGVLTLQKPTSKVYTGSNTITVGVGVPGAVTVTDAAGLLFYDVSVEGCTANNLQNDFIYFGQIIGGKILNNNVTISPTSTRGTLMNQYYPLSTIEIAGNKFVAGAGAFIIQPSAGMRDVFIHDNDFSSPYGANPINPSEGVVNMKISNNSIYMTIPQGASVNNAGLLFSTTYNATVDHNHIFVANNGSSQGYSAINLAMNNGPCTNCIFDSNVITGYNVSAVIQVGNAPNLKVTNNVITGIASHKIITTASGGGAYTGNIIRSQGSNVTLLYMTELNAGQNVFANNSITADTSIANVPGIRISNTTGSNNNVVSGNYIAGIPRGIQVDSGTPTTFGNVCDGITTYTAYCSMNLSGTAVMGTTALAAGTCATAVTVAAAGAISTDTISWSYNTGTYTFLTVGAYATTGNVNFLICNPTASSVTPPAVTLNWRIIR